METDSAHWVTTLEELLCEIVASKEAYEEMSLTEELERKRIFFMQQAAQRKEFEKNLREEIVAVKEGGVYKLKKDSPCIYDGVAATVGSRNLTAIEVDRLILLREKDLIKKYQEVLNHKNLPDTTDAILQAQAEDINDIIQKLVLELNLEENNF